MYAVATHLSEVFLKREIQTKLESDRFRNDIILKELNNSLIEI